MPWATGLLRVAEWGAASTGTGGQWGHQGLPDQPQPQPHRRGAPRSSPALARPPPAPHGPPSWEAAQRRREKFISWTSLGEASGRLHVAVPRRPQRRSRTPASPSSLGTLRPLPPDPSQTQPLFGLQGATLSQEAEGPGSCGAGACGSPHSSRLPCSPAPRPRPRSSSVCQARPGTAGTQPENRTCMSGWGAGKTARPAHRRCSDSPSHPGREDTGDVGAVAWHVYSRRCVNVAPDPAGAQPQP